MALNSILMGRPLGSKNSIFSPQMGHFGHSRPENGPPSGQTATSQKYKVIQRYLRIWGTYDPIELGPSEPKKWGFHRCSVKKCRILGKKWVLAAGPRPTLQQGQHKNVAYWVSSHDSNKKFGCCIFLCYTYETPIFSAQTDPTQLDHKSPIS